MQADILGSLSDMGVFETGEGALPDPGPIELVKTPGGWRIDRLPNGVFLDWQQFQADLQALHAVLRRPHRQHRRPRPALRRGVGSRQLATELMTKLVSGPRPEMANTVRNLLGPRCGCAAR